MVAPCYGLLDLELYSWYTRPDGSLEADSDFYSSSIDLEEDLGYKDFSQTAGGSLVLGMHHQIEVSFLALDMSASNQLREDFNFGDLRFPAGSKVDSNIDVSGLGGAYRFEAGSDLLRGGFLAGIRHFGLSVGSESQAVGKAQRDVDAIIPVAGLFVSGHPLPFLNFKASATAGRWEFDGEESTFMEMDLGLLMEMPPGFYLGVGYRRMLLEHHSDSLDIDMPLAGPMAFVGFRL